MFTSNRGVNMESVTVSMRLSKSEAHRLAQQAREMGIERPTFLKRALRRGAEDLVFDRACDAYRRGEATLSRAAEIAGLSLRDMILRMQGANLDLSYGTEDLARDLAG
jgi:predicted HTH domain antitoxin